MALIRGVVTGATQSKQALRRAERQARHVTMRQATRIVQDEAKRRAPTASNKLKRSVRIGGVGKIRSKLPYARYVHWGTKRRGKKDAQPFIIDAINAKTYEIVSAYASELARKMHKAIRKR